MLSIEAALDAILAKVGNDPAAIMMIGLPACGKSTFVAQLRQKIDTAVISMDAFRELICTEMGIRYEDSMVETRNAQWDRRNRAMHATLMQIMNMMASETYAAGRSLVWDRTNLTKAQRTERFSQTLGYYRIGVYTPSTPEDCLKRCEDRALATGKIIPPSVLESMFKQLEIPEESEFDLLITV